MGQTTHQDLVNKFGLRRILFDKSCLLRIFCYKTFGLRRMILIKHLLFNHSGMHLIWSFLFCLPIHWWWKWFKRSVYESASDDIIWVTRRDRDSGEQTTWMKQSLPQRYVCVGCQLNSDKALRLSCLKWHIRARDSTLWQEASEFFCMGWLRLVGSLKLQVSLEI